MAPQLNIWFALTITFTVSGLQLFGHAQPQVPCYFIFGDSLVDNGNNNLLNTTAKANYAPYGIDYPKGPTGRFSNGRNLVDFLADYLGFEYSIPPFAYARGKRILKGVNYGSGAAGIRDETGQQRGDRISLNKQLQNHNTAVSRIASLLGNNATNYLKTCLYSVGMGSNDYINNYLVPEYYNTSTQYTPTQYAAALIEQYSQQLQTLYKYGARKIAIFGLGFIGCIPYENTTSRSTPCSTTANVDAQLFDTELPLLVDRLNNNFTDAKFIYVNVTHISLTTPPNSGIKVTNAPCCIVSTMVGGGQCEPNRVPCSNRTIFEFYDSFHPAEYAISLLATRAYSSQTQLDDYPMDISSLAQLQL